MKKVIVVCLVALGIIGAPQNVEAQGFLKKLSKGLESVNKGLDKAGDKASVATGQAVTQENGVFVMNPVSKEAFVNIVVSKELYLNKDLTLGDLANAFKTNRTYMGKYLNTICEQPFWDFINQLRIEQKVFP